VKKEIDVLSDTETRQRRYVYDAAGNVVESIDEEGNVTRYAYDSLGRLASLIDPLENETRYTYDDRGNLLSVQDPMGRSTYYEYERNNRLIKTIRPLQKETTFEYDANGNRSAVVDNVGQRIEFDHDAANRVSQVRYYEAGNLTTPVKTVDFTYDEIGNLTGYSDGVTSADYTYDALSRKLSETVDYGELSLSYGYSYDGNGLKKTFTGPDGVTISYTYDENNRISGVTVPGQGMVSYNVYEWNSPAKITLPGGSVVDTQYDPLMRIKEITSKDPGGNPLVTRGYTYSPAGNITEKQTEHGTYNYSYDDLYRLTEALNPLSEDEQYTYDALGNRLTSAENDDWKYNENNELTGYDGVSFTYDDNGYVTGRTTPSGTQQFVYDVEGRMVRVEDGAGATVAEYYYDPFGRRLWKDVDGTRTYFLYSDEGLIGEYDAAGTELRTYGYVPGGLWSTDPLFQKSNGLYRWYLNDAQGTPQKVTTASGAVVWSGIYDAFGNVQITADAGFTNNLRFAGMYHDQETGLYYNLHRYYDPQTGRYLQTDPMGDGLNLYAYVYGNPNVLIDPYGLCAVKKFFTLQGQSNFWAGFGDTITLGGTKWIRYQWNKNVWGFDVVNYDSSIYSIGKWSGYAWELSTVSISATKFSISKVFKTSTVVGGSLGASVGAVSSIYKEENVLRGALVGALIGGTSGKFGWGKSIIRSSLLGGTIGATTDFISQSISNRLNAKPFLHRINYTSVFISGLAGAVGGGSQMASLKGGSDLVTSVLVGDSIAGGISLGLTYVDNR